MKLLLHGTVIAIVASLVMLIACGVQESGPGAAEDSVSTPFKTLEASRTPTPDRQNSTPTTPRETDPTVVEAVSSELPTQTPRIMHGQSSLFVNFPDLAHLVWASNAIIRGVITNELEPKKLPSQGGPIDNEARFYTDYMVNIKATYRGDFGNTLNVSRMGGQIGDIALINESIPELHVGDEVVLFLVSSEQRNQASWWLSGGPQGLWWIQDDEVRPVVEGQFQVMTVQELEQAMIEILRLPPPEDLQVSQLLVPLDSAPIGVDLQLAKPN